MKKILSILLAVLVLGACGTATMDAKKRTTRKAKAKTTAVSVSKLTNDVNRYCQYLQYLQYLQESIENAELGENTEDLDQQVELAREAANIAISIAKLRPKIRSYEKAGKLSSEQISKIKSLEAEHNR